MSCQNQHFLCNFIPIGQLKDPFLDKQSPTIRTTLNFLMTVIGFFIDNLNLKLAFMQKNVQESKFTY